MSLLQLRSSSRGGCCFDFTPFLKKYRKIFAFRLPVRPTPAFPSPDNLSAAKARLSSVLVTSVKPERASSTYFGGRGRGGQSEPTPTNAPFFWFLINEYFRCYFFLNPDLHITFSPGYPTDLHLGPAYQLTIDPPIYLPTFPFLV